MKIPIFLSHMPESILRLYDCVYSMLHRRYLRQMITASIVFILIPIFISSWYLLHYSVDELRKSNEEFYAQSAKMFSDSFSERVMLLHQHAVQISADSRNSKRGAFQMQRDALLEAPVNYYSVFIKQLAQYDYSISDEWGVYYQEYDILFSGNFKYTMEEYISIRQPEADPSFSADMTEFFKTDSPGLRICPNYSTSANGTTYVGYAGTMGLAHDKVVFFYRLHAKTIGLDSVLAQQNMGAQFVLFDKNTGRVLFLSGNEHLYPTELFQMYSDGLTTTTIEGIEYRLFLSPDDSNKWVSGVLLPSLGANTSIVQFCNTTSLILLCVTVILILLLITFIQHNYRPVHQTMKSLGIDSDDEFRLLHATYEQMQDELLERNQRILDLLLRNLLYNVPISSDYTELLGVSSNGKSYSVCVMVGTLDSKKRSMLMKTLYEELNIVAAITDILAIDYTVIICCSQQEIDHAALSKWLVDYFQANLPECPKPQIGSVVDHLNRIHESYASCFVQREDENGSVEESLLMPDPEDKKYNSRLNALKEQIEGYIQQNLGDATLSQTSVADHFCVSVYSISRLFKNQIGMSFSDFVNSLRIQAAHDLLIQTDQSITNICKEVGFSNLSYFSRLFKLKYGATPSSFRKEQAEANAAAEKPL